MRMSEVAGVQIDEKFEDYTEQQLIDELWGQLQNLQHFIPSSREQFEQQLNNNTETYVQIANNIIDAAAKMERR